MAVVGVQVGGDIGLHVGQNFIESFPERVIRSQLIPLMNKAGRLGEKTGSGFYLHKARKALPDPAVQEVLAAARAASGLEKVRPASCAAAAGAMRAPPLFVSHAGACVALQARGDDGKCTHLRLRAKTAHL